MEPTTRKRSPRTLWLSTLIRLQACADARAWARSLPSDTSPESAWSACECGDWLMWLLGALHRRGAITRQVLVLAACAAARTALPYLAGRPAEAASLAAIEAAERWCRGEATIDEVRAARDAAWAVRCEAWPDAAAAAAAAAYAAAAAAAAAAYAADAAYAYAAADAAYAYAAAAAYAAARTKHLYVVADAIRAAVPWDVVAAGVEMLSQKAVA